MFQPTTVVFAYRSSLALLKEWRCLLFCMVVTKHHVYDLLPCFSSVLIGSPVDHKAEF